MSELKKEPKKETTEDYKPVSLDKIKFIPKLPKTIKSNISESDAESSDDEVQFVKAERITRPAPNSAPLKLMVPQIRKEPVPEPTVDPLAVAKYYPCNQCKKILSSGEDLIKHLELRHMKQRKKRPKKVDDEVPGPKVCDICGLTFEKLKSLCAHMNCHKDHDREPVECKICGEKFSSLGTLWNHKKAEHIQDLHKCETCNKTFVTQVAYEKHLEKHAEEGVIMCDICGKIFNTRKALDTHVYSHTGEKPFLCSECGAAFTSNQCLREHYKRHNGVKKHACNVCGKAFFEKSKLKKHSYIHSKQKPHICEICGKGFVFPFFARQHKRTHTGEKPFKCTFDENSCQKQFTSNAQLKRHIAGYHKGERPFKCEICDKAFVDKQKLDGHNKRVHIKPQLQNTYHQPPPPPTPDDDSISENRDIKIPPAVMAQHGYMGIQHMHPLNYHKAHLDASMM